VTYASALTAAIARLVAAGLVECRSPAGLLGAGAPRGHRAVACLPAGDRKQRSREAARADGLRVTARFTVQLGHELKPGAGLEAPSQALQDLHSAQRFLIQPGTSLTNEGALTFGPVTTTRLQGGAYMVQAFELGVTFNLDMSAP